MGKKKSCVHNKLARKIQVNWLRWGTFLSSMKIFVGVEKLKSQWRYKNLQWKTMASLSDRYVGVLSACFSCNAVRCVASLVRPLGIIEVDDSRPDVQDWMPFNGKFPHKIWLRHKTYQFWVIWPWSNRSHNKCLTCSGEKIRSSPWKIDKNKKE